MLAAQPNREAGGLNCRPPTWPPTQACRVERRACSRRRGAADASRSAVLHVWGRFTKKRSDAPIATTDARINERIRAREVRLVGPNGDQIGVKPLPEALHIAREHDLDLVEVAPNANPPVCKIMDFGKFKYEQDVRRKESRRKATNVVIKEMKFRPKIDEHDYTTKTKHVERFLNEGSKVKITIMFRGREMAHPELGKKILDRISEQVRDLATVESSPRVDGRNMVMVLAPAKKPEARPPRAAGAGPAPAPAPVPSEPPPAPSEAAPPEAAPPEAAPPEAATVTPSP
ncbi:MAG: translation initiation factor IF-3 [Acidimicrobiia bacterium]